MLVSLSACFSLSLFAQGDFWTKKTDMPTQRFDLAVSAVDGKIYAIGGVKFEDQNNCIIVPALEEYDPIKNEWKKKRDMPKAIEGLSASVVDGKIYTIGGSDKFSRLSYVMEYDPAKDKWTKKNDMPRQVAQTSTCVVNRKIYAIGGLKEGNPNPISVSATMEYNPVTDTWINKTDMPTPRYDLATAVLNGKIYAIGGIRDLLNVSSAVEEYDPVTDAWIKKADIPNMINDVRILYFSFKCAVTIKNKIYVTGNGAIEEYDPVTDTWTKKQDMPSLRGVYSAATVNGKVYVIGGAAEGVILSTVEEYTPDDWTISVSSKQKVATTWANIKVENGK